jgi:hypothetical protein
VHPGGTPHLAEELQKICRIPYRSIAFSVAELAAGEDILFTGLKHVEIFGDILPMSISLTGSGPPFGILNPNLIGDKEARLS